MTIRNEITLTTMQGAEVLTLRRFALKIADFSGITGRRHMLNLRRKEQLSRVQDMKPKWQPRKRSFLAPIPGENLIKRDDGTRFHPTKGDRPVTEYERSQIK